MEGSRKGRPGGAKLDAELGTTLCPRRFLQSLACCPRSFCFFLPTCLLGSGCFANRLAVRLPCSQPDTALRYLHSPSFACVFPSSRLAPRSLRRPTYSSRRLQCRRRSPQKISSSEPARRALTSIRGSSMGLKSRSTSNRRPRRITRGAWVYGRGRFTALSPLHTFREAHTLNRYAQEHPGADPYDLETLKGFVRMMAYGIDGVYSDPKAGKKSILQYWKDFTAG